MSVPNLNTPVLGPGKKKGFLRSFLILYTVKLIAFEVCVSENNHCAQICYDISFQDCWHFRFEDVRWFSSVWKHTKRWPLFSFAVSESIHFAFVVSVFQTLLRDQHCLSVHRAEKGTIRSANRNSEGVCDTRTQRKWHPWSGKNRVGLNPGIPHSGRFPWYCSNFDLQKWCSCDWSFLHIALSYWNSESIFYLFGAVILLPFRFVLAQPNGMLSS